MRFALAALFMMPLALYGSTLEVGVRYHSTMVNEGGEKQLVYAVFADENVVADVRLDVYQLAELPSTSASFEALRQLTQTNWLHNVQFELLDRSRGGSRTLQASDVRKNGVRDRGPSAALAANRDSSVECRTFEATVDFGRLAVGEYTLASSLAGLRHEFRFVVRTGVEREWRDIYLQDKAIHAKTYDEYRRLTLDRIKWDEDRASTVLDLIDRSLQYGTLQETISYVGRLRAIAERRSRAGKSSTIETGEARAYLVELERTLPEYFNRRDEWTMVRDADTGRHLIKNRRTGVLVKTVGDETR